VISQLRLELLSASALETICDVLRSMSVHGWSNKRQANI